MTQPPVTDAEIVAFLDDALPAQDQARVTLAIAENPDVARRVEEMALDRDRLQGAFDELLSAAPTLPTVQAVANRTTAPSRWWQAAAAAALLVVGVAIGTQLPTHKQPDWHMAVAEYQVLYATETLTGMELTEDQRWGSLSRTASSLGLKLTPQSVQLEGLDFRRAQLLSHQGSALAQLAFLDANGDAIAFCFTRTGGADQAAEAARLDGLNAVTWQTNGMGFILIGGQDADALNAWQVALASEIDT